MADESLVTPLAPSAAVPPAPTDVAPADAGAAPAEDDTTPLPDELLKIPAFQALFAGSPPALSFDIAKSKNREETKLVVDNKDALMAAGIGFYRALSGKTGVMFNQLRVHGEDIQAADKMGKLQVIAPDFDAVNHAVAKSGLKNPVLAVSGVPGGPASPRSGGAGVASGSPQASPAPSPLPLPSPGGSGSRGAQRLLAKRVSSLEPGSPLSGPVPGAGRLMTQILKPVL